MIKNLRLLLFSMLAMLSGTVLAGSITFGELGLENSVQYSDPFDGGDFTVTFSGGSNDGKYYNTGSGIRVYGGGMMTIAAKEGTLKRITITFDGANKPEASDVVDGGTYDPATGVWTGDAAKVVFTRPSGSGHWRVQKIETGDGGDTPDPNAKGTLSNPYTIEEMVEAGVDAMEGKSVYVKGFITNVDEVSTQYGNATFKIATANEKDAQYKLKIYRGKFLENAAFTSENQIKVGDQVVVYGTFQLYNGEGQLVSGYIYSLNGKTKDDTPSPEPQDVEEVNVKQALDIINALEDSKTTSEEYIVKGFVVEVKEISTSYGNATFTIADAKDGKDVLTVYRAKDADGEKITDEQLLKAGDEVTVRGKLQKYVKDGNVTPEVATGGKILTVNGQSTSNVEAVRLTREQGAVYTLGGQRVQTPAKGLFIRNGRKFVVK